MSIWEACREEADPASLTGELVRIAEGQEQAATHALVDNLAEEALLEEMLEANKPPLPRESIGLHYLLATPFRYPPLRYGSRFGSRHEPSLLYGSAALTTALAEAAYYRLLFWAGMDSPPPGGRLTTEHTAFGAGYETGLGLSLHQPPFAGYEEQLADPGSYGQSQPFGRNMREAGIEAFEFRSARDPDGGTNIALFTPKALAASNPMWQQAWLCDTRAEGVAFFNKEQGVSLFERELFLHEGVLPHPAT